MIKQSPFGIRMAQQQVKWRANPANCVCTESGWQNKSRRPWILPSEKWEQNLWPGIRAGTSNSLPDYLAESKVQPHEGKHNLKSSWVLCANLYFPFKATPEGLELLAGFLREHVSPDVKTIDELHLEYAEDGELHPSNLLGEPGGSRGSGQTSPDLAFHVNGRKGLILIENKFTEHSFYPCSARRRTDSKDRPGNPDPTRCKNINGVLRDYRTQCHQCVWGRKYWDILRPVMNEPAMTALKCCPATSAGYQLFRQQALAEGIATHGPYEFVYSCVALDARNTTLLNCLKKTGISNLDSGWPTLFNGKARFKTFTHQQWVAWVKTHGTSSVWNPWLDYVSNRYLLME